MTRLLRPLLVAAVLTLVGVGAYVVVHQPVPAAEAGCIPHDKCCRVCSKGKACGDSCIKREYTCTKPRGCACNSSEVCP